MKTINLIIDELLNLIKLKSSFKYKLFYILDRLINFIPFLLWKNLKSSYFLKWNFIIKNSLGTFKILEPSDMHFILKPHYEKDLLKYFQLNWWIFLDIWTNVWKYSVHVWKQNKNNLVYSFEPNTYLYENYLSENIKLNKLKNVKLNNIWLSNKEWSFTLTVPESNFWSWSIDNKYSYWKKYKINLLTLNNFILNNSININNIRLIKIDVEWHEYNVLLWAKEIFIKLNKCRLIIELFEKSENFENTINLIKSFWFKQEDKLYWDNYIFYKN